MEINGFNNYNNSFSGINKGNGTVVSQEKKDKFQNVLMPNLCKAYYDLAEKEVSEYGFFGKVYAEFPIPETINKGQLYITPDTKDRTQRYLSIGVHHPNSDRMVSNFLLKGTKKEILDYIKDSKNYDEIINSAFNLSKEVDEFYN